MPISYADAIPILSALNGHGPSASDLDEGWHGGGLKAHGVHYHVGPSPDGIKLNIISHADINPSQVHNVIATIPGSISDEATFWATTVIPGVPVLEIQAVDQQPLTRLSAASASRFVRAGDRGEL